MRTITATLPHAPAPITVRIPAEFIPVPSEETDLVTANDETIEFADGSTHELNPG